MKSDFQMKTLYLIFKNPPCKNNTITSQGLPSEQIVVVYVRDFWILAALLYQMKVSYSIPHV